jgi:hypothetical protein
MEGLDSNVGHGVAESPYADRERGRLHAANLEHEYVVAGRVEEAVAQPIAELQFVLRWESFPAVVARTAAHGHLPVLRRLTVKP